MMSSNVILFCFISLIISFIFPILFIIYLIKKINLSFKALILGAVVYIIVPVFIKDGVMHVINVLVYNNKYMDIYTYSLYKGFMEALLSEMGRFFALYFLLRKSMNINTGLAYGLGHGTFQSFYSTVFNGGVTNLVNAILLSLGSLDSFYRFKGMNTDTIYMIKDSLIGTPVYTFLYPGMQSAFMIIIQIVFSILVVNIIVNKKYGFMLLMLFVHTIIVSLSVWLDRTLILLFILAVCSGFGILLLIKMKIKIKD